MRTFKILIAICFLVARFANGQDQAITVTQNKTTSLIFQNSIKSVDRGSQDILAQKAKGVENVLQLKAAKSAFPETNITVITAEGALHQFSVNYAERPAVMAFSVDQNGRIAGTKEQPLIFGTDLSEPQMELLARQLIRAKGPILKRSRDNGISLVLKEIRIRNNSMLYSIRILNNTNISYDIEGIRLYILDKSKMKRTASQEVEVAPVYTYGGDKAIPGQTSRPIVFVIGKFTIPDAKRFVIEVTERNGSRHLKLKIKNSQIVKAKRI